MLLDEIKTLTDSFDQAKARTLAHEQANDAIPDREEAERVQRLEVSALLLGTLLHPSFVFEEVVFSSLMQTPSLGLTSAHHESKGIVTNSSSGASPD
jgi:hypothetical protein